MTGEPKQEAAPAPERVYVVRLTEGAFNFVRDRRWGVQILDKRCAKFAEEIRSARPEHPGRQAALEELARWMLDNFHPIKGEGYDCPFILPGAAAAIESRLEKLRTMEAK